MYGFFKYLLAFGYTGLTLLIAIDLFLASNLTLEISFALSLSNFKYLSVVCTFLVTSSTGYLYTYSNTFYYYYYSYYYCCCYYYYFCSCYC